MSSVPHDRIFCLTAVEDGTPIDWTQFTHILGEGALSLSDEIEQASHDIRDMLLLCTWRGVEVCNNTDFKRLWTDWGLCYSFNNAEDKSHVRRVNQPGSRYGLHLRLMVEQHEYTLSEYNGAGFKVSVQQGSCPI